jgi:hypothetical protein
MVPANGGRPARQSMALQESKLSSKEPAQQKQASRSLTHAFLALDIRILVTRPCDLKTSSDKRSAPADKLRIGSEASYRALVAMFPDGSRTHPIMPPQRGGRWKPPERMVNGSRGK